MRPGSAAVGPPLSAGGDEDRVDDVDSGVGGLDVAADHGGAIDAGQVAIGGDLQLFTLDGGDRPGLDQIGQVGIVTGRRRSSRSAS